MHTRTLILICAALLMAACQTTVPQVERTRTFTQDKQAIWDRLMEFLERNQIKATKADFASGKVEAERRDFEDIGWADCQRAQVRQETRTSWALRVDRDLALEVGVAGAAGATEVTVDARFTEEQISTANYTHFVQACRSTGVLETALLNALGGPAAARPGTDSQKR